MIYTIAQGRYGAKGRISKDKSEAANEFRSLDPTEYSRSFYKTYTSYEEMCEAVIEHYLNPYWKRMVVTRVQ